MKKRVIVDSDMGWDDVLSLCYLLKNPHIDLVGILTTGCGETNLPWANTIAQNILGLAQRFKTVVAKGSEQPLALNNRFPQDFKNDMNSIMGLLGTLNPENVPALDERPAHVCLLELLRSSSEKVTLLCLGGFTNLAKMLQSQARAEDLAKIENVYAMAGAVYVDGNVADLNNAAPQWDQGHLYSSNHWAEWNVFIDPVATQMVLNAPIPLTLIPLDVCNHVLLSPGYASTITAQDPLATLARGVLQAKSEGHAEGSLTVPIFDPLATLIMTGDVHVNKTERVFLDVNVQETSPTNRCGELLVKSHGSRPVQVVLGVSKTAFAIQYAKVMNTQDSACTLGA